jgi:glutamate synthase domain-containing protein 2
MLLGHKISDRVAAMRDLPKGIDQRSASRHPDWTGPDDLEIKIASCARSPTGRSRSSSRSARRARTTTCSSR